MLYRKMPRGADELSILGFGCMRLPLLEGRIDEERATRQLRHAIDNGVNYVDTAWPYHGGASEPFVGRALRDGYRERVKVATKLPSWLVHNRADMDRFLDAQLEKLSTAQVDYYLVHSLDGAGWDRMAALGVADFLDRAKASGRIVNAGFSYHGVGGDFARVVDAYGWDFCQIQYNYLDQERQAGAEGLRYAASQGLGVMVMEPLRGGTLAAAPPEPVAALWSEAASARTPAEWALRWVWNHPEVTLALSGMNDESQVEENLRVAGVAHPGSLSAGEMALVARVARQYRDLLKVDCTGCAYCQPCPSDVDIPGCLETLNTHFTYGKVQEAAFLYTLRLSGTLTGRRSYASQCSHCNDCLDKCPQSLPIPDLLEEAATLFESHGLSEREAAVARLFQ